MKLLDRSPGLFFVAVNTLVYTFIVGEALLIWALPDSIGVALAATLGVLACSATCTVLFVKGMFRLLEEGGAADEHAPVEPAAATETSPVAERRRHRRVLVARPVH